MSEKRQQKQETSVPDDHSNFFVNEVENKDTLVSDDHSNSNENNSDGDDESTDQNEESDIQGAIDCMFRNLTRFKDDIKTKNLNETKEQLEQIRSAANLMFEDKPLMSMQTKILNDFNIECDKIRESKKSNKNYKKYFVDKIEFFLTEMKKVEIEKNMTIFKFEVPNEKTIFKF